MKLLLLHLLAINLFTASQGQSDSTEGNFTATVVPVITTKSLLDNPTTAAPSFSSPPSASLTAVESSPSFFSSGATTVSMTATESLPVISTSLITSSVNPSSSIISSSILPSLSLSTVLTSSANSSDSVQPTSTSAFAPNSTIMPPSNSSIYKSSIATETLSPSIEPWSVSTHSLPSSSQHVTPTMAPDVIYECGAECKSLRHKLYAASAFAILFVIVTLVLGGLLYRQYRISRDYREDPSLSRLI